jgi:hypothetical protein
MQDSSCPMAVHSSPLCLRKHGSGGALPILQSALHPFHQCRPAHSPISILTRRSADRSSSGQMAMRVGHSTAALMTQFEFRFDCCEVGRAIRLWDVPNREAPAMLPCQREIARSAFQIGWRYLSGDSHSCLSQCVNEMCGVERFSRTADSFRKFGYNCSAFPSSQARSRCMEVRNRRLNGR